MCIRAQLLNIQIFTALTLFIKAMRTARPTHFLSFGGHREQVRVFLHVDAPTVSLEVLPLLLSLVVEHK